MPAQRAITLTEDQQKTVRELTGKVKPKIIAETIGVSYAKLFNNLTLMGLTKKKGRARVIVMEGYFDVDKFYKQYYLQSGI